MNVNSDDDAQTRAPPPRPRSRGRGCRRPGRRTCSGNASPAKPASRHAFQLAHGYSSRSSAPAAFGAMCSLGEPPHRLAELDVLVGEDRNAVTPGRERRGRAAPAARHSRDSFGERPRLAVRRSSSGPRRRAPAGACSRARHRARAAPATRRIVVGGPVVAEQLDAQRRCRRSPAHGRTARRACPRSRRAPRTTSSACSCGDRRRRESRPAPRACSAYPTFGPGRAHQRSRRARRRPDAAPSPGGRPASRARAAWPARAEVLLLAGPVADLRRNERVSRHRRDGTRCRRPPQIRHCAPTLSSRRGADRSGSSRAGPATTPR